MHGDSSAYQALVSMGQSFKVYPLLLNKSGNFGNILGDPASAMR